MCYWLEPLCAPEVSEQTVRAEALLLYVVSPSGGGTVDVDNVRLLEWRAASDLPAGAWVEADAVQAKAGIAAGLKRRDCS